MAINKKYERQLKKGVFEILVLQLLSEHEKYGYELLTEMKARSNEMFTVKEGTLYPILYRLEDEGLVVSKWTEPKAREVSRKYYSITMPGLVVLDELKELWKNFSSNVNNILLN
ncbi:PadR family transcriptional regulator [Lachnospira multipara]|jgi:PadR family transcriptional regulator PadR|uniref:PadR family transcriptional regulator n=1 Tax=Lachnospira multipara TaxID=28051 RepID=UPI0004E0F68C|nr:PadR family transcriptional regulator [Lachnospira multipara]